MTESHHTGTIKRSITVNVPDNVAWRRISNIIGMPAWAAGVKDARHASTKKRGVGAVRVITFENGDTVEEHIIEWDNGRSFTYVATDGLPLRAYVATMSVRPQAGRTRIVWRSYMNSRSMTAAEFDGFLESMRSFYEGSLRGLKSLLEK